MNCNFTKLSNKSSYSQKCCIPSFTQSNEIPFMLNLLLFIKMNISTREIFLFVLLFIKAFNPTATDLPNILYYLFDLNRKLYRNSLCILYDSSFMFHFAIAICLRVKKIWKYFLKNIHSFLTISKTLFIFREFSGEKNNSVHVDFMFFVYFVCFVHVSDGCFHMFQRPKPIRSK